MMRIIFNFNCYSSNIFYTEQVYVLVALFYWPKINTYIVIQSFVVVDAEKEQAIKSIDIDVFAMMIRDFFFLLLCYDSNIDQDFIAVMSLTHSCQKAI